MRGEDSAALCAMAAIAGSPPHARGRLDTVLQCGGSRGITPACAGKTSAFFLPRSEASDHPRMRGEDLPSPIQTALGLGSPPHARGRPRLKLRSVSSTGITPACAGKTRRLCAPWRRSPDHPRMRGEDWILFYSVAEVVGSPPHARGRLQPFFCLARRLRITPACAGKTACHSPGFSPCADHPRMRGEDASKTLLPRGSPGSPPHARGRHWST